MSHSSYVFDVDAAGFQSAVLDRSHEVPVVVDFWAAWCGPCRTLGPMLEEAIDARGGSVLLAKVDVDANQSLAQAFRVQGIPQVIAVRDGKVVDQFTGAQPLATIEAFLDRVCPSEADRAVAQARMLEGAGAINVLRTALELEPGHREAALLLAEHLVDEDPDQAVQLVTPHRPDPAAEAIVTRVELTRDGRGDITAMRARLEAGEPCEDGALLYDLGRALAAAGEYDEAFERLLSAVECRGPDRERAREQLVALFTVLGDDDARVRAARPRLARALF